ncbi:MAG: Fumarylacetoacetate hydrolase family protein [Thermococcus sibiricus]|uniref:Fumarylacetoacetate hydrolase family protein n=1 Tax=Thermococcus sibiricus TaxID=172049 RepID=A0A101EKA2_9EURY|nr:fumarylacetoacetate hydrolase family protein [Thermococcus sp. 101 C5]KUK16947.1 MAG: Fumarylacetoacetate hydrolase family protein [Thermococcus sibiricus]
MVVRLPFGDTVYEVKPTKIIGLGKNYLAPNEPKENAPEKPIIFLKPPSSLIGPDETIIIPKLSKEVHHEVELGVIIGKRGKNIPREEAFDYILGYTVLLDITARDIITEAIKKGLPWAVAKGFDTFTPVGPRIVGKDELDPSDLEIGLKVNGEVRQLSRTSRMIFRIDEIIEYVSKIMTLEPGDIIATGTPEGVDLLKPGDVVEGWIEGIGILKERVDVEK